MTARFGLRDHLSPSALGAWDRCELQYKAFRVDGILAPPDASLTVKQTNHKVILEDDLGYKVLTGHNRAGKELSEIYRADMEKALPIFREDPNLETPIEKFVEDEVSYFDEILKATEPFRRETVPLEVEHQVNFTLGGVPIESRLDLISGEDGFKRIEDLKRQGSAPPEGSAAKSRQLATYAAGTGIREVGLVAVVENKRPTVKLDQGTISDGVIERTKLQYQAAAFQIENAMKSGIFKPVDTSDKARAWICSARFCGVWKSDARDVKTGANVSCPFGERSQVSV